MKTVAACLVPTFPLSSFWHVASADHYDRLEMCRDDVHAPLGIDLVRQRRVRGGCLVVVGLQFIRVQFRAVQRCQLGLRLGERPLLAMPTGRLGSRNSTANGTKSTKGLC